MLLTKMIAVCSFLHLHSERTEKKKKVYETGIQNHIWVTIETFSVRLKTHFNISLILFLFI